MTSTYQSVSLDDAQRVIDAARSRAEEISSPSNIAVVDAGGNLVAHARMDGAWIGSIDIAINKAYTARALDIATAELAAAAAPGQQFYGIHVSNGGRIMIFAGGIPLRKDDEIVGAVGVSGGTGEQDTTVAEAAAAAL
ncbi:GlcG/HbpS family heme-binding protein [Mycolicibacter senuensis]|uniref:PduO protein n=1 Tax=Mycolicibacter senuensis TaxID=386913 RepID=A0A7I9XQ01_9MYCO|nr:heme-binding protein [Mycolicibacter senuensis]MDQ2628051.1 heme-binding protein [Actinomycetota bacterium]ORW64040.1 cobalamin adenosyltransferase [Mycolicibacter senuensis]GFG72029.1 PduO protein [Mycolicibacter senuensis]